MTRPMPGPPAHDRYARPHRQFADERCSTCYSPGWTLPKWLTDAECAAEYWRAEADEMVHSYTWYDSEFRDEEADDAYAHIRSTWHRFARTPHALEES